MVFLTEREADRVPDVDAGALLARVAARDAPDLAVLDDGAVRLADVDAEDRPADPAGTDDGARSGDVDAGRVLPEVAALPGRRCRSPRPSRSAPSPGRRSRTASRGGAGVRGRRAGRGGRGTRSPSYVPGGTSTVAAGRRGVDELLQRRGVVRGGTPLEGRRRGRRPSPRPAPGGRARGGARPRGAEHSHVRPRSSASRAIRRRTRGRGRASRAPSAYEPACG